MEAIIIGVLIAMGILLILLYSLMKISSIEDELSEAMHERELREWYEKKKKEEYGDE